MEFEETPCLFEPIFANPAMLGCYLIDIILNFRWLLVDSNGRQRNHFEPYNVMRVCESDRIYRRLKKDLFERLA